jgi:hypothetical protein
MLVSMSDEKVAEVKPGADADAALDDEGIEPPIPLQELLKARADLAARCKSAGLTLEERTQTEHAPSFKLGMKCGRDVRWLFFGSDEGIARILSVPFEKFVFLGDYEAICSYQDGLIEAAIRANGPGFAPSSFMFRRVFDSGGRADSFDIDAVKLLVEPPDTGIPRIEISPASDVFTTLRRAPGRARLTLKLTNCKIANHDQALALLNRTANSLFFQIDLLSDVAIMLERERRRFPPSTRAAKTPDLANDLQYPKTEFDDAPLSLYWYARSAFGMPLLQFLAFYQVIEFYFPTYSKAEAQRKLKAILKDPTFRGDRDADIGKLLSTIYVTRTGAFGDERSQLRATLTECVDSAALRGFLECDDARKEFYSTKGKDPLYHKIPLSNPTADLRNDVADRIYDIRCRIVHTKNDSREGELELLLPFSAEAQKLSVDIELVQHLAQAVLIAGSTPMRRNP